MKMLEAARELTQQFRAVRLHRDDLEQIADMIESAGFTLSFGDATHQFEHLDEIQQHRGVHPRSLWIEAVHPGHADAAVDISITGSEVSLWIRGADELGALPYELRDFLNARSLTYLREIRPLNWAIIFFLALFLRASGWGMERNGEDAWPGLLVGLASVAVLGGLIRSYLLGIWLRPRHEGGFIQRNRDRLLVALIAAALSALLTTLLPRAF